MRKPNKKQRRIHYELAIKEYQTNDYALGMCIVLANIAHGSLFKAPWSDFKDLTEYYPELEYPRIYKPYNKERIDILNYAIKQLNI